MGTLRRSDDSGLTLYVILRNASHQPVIASTGGVEAYNASDWANYAHAATEQGATGYYYAVVNNALPVGTYWIEWRYRAGTSPAITDGVRASGSAYWDGTNWLPDWAVKLAKSANPIAGSMEAVSPANQPIVDSSGNTRAVDSSGNAIPTATQIATQVEKQIVDDTDTTAVMQAIVDKINSLDPNLATLTTSSIAAAVVALAKAQSVLTADQVTQLTTIAANILSVKTNLAALSEPVNVSSDGTIIIES